MLCTTIPYAPTPVAIHNHSRVFATFLRESDPSMTGGLTTLIPHENVGSCDRLDGPRRRMA
ncbi:MAG: hypothetical protein GX307_01265 [Euryarchaeota archaeon]|nr:hypothetical protein [Euryarchaeota archaeon]